MSEKDFVIVRDGGAAFPRPGFDLPGVTTPHETAPQGGMSLRDYLAARAMVVCYGRLDFGEEWAAAAYAMADSMLVARDMKP